MQFVLGWREVISACLDCGLLAIEHGQDWAGPIPPIVFVQARRAVRNGVELAVALDRYRAVYQAAYDFVLEEVEASEVPEPHRAILLREASAATTALLIRVLTETTHVHIGELKHGVQTSAQRHDELVLRVLAGRRVDHKELDYDLGTEHLALIASGTGAARGLTVLAERAGRRLLSVEQDDGMVWAWLGGLTRLAADAVVRYLPNGAYADVAFAVGRPASGMAGFRRTHRQAQSALLVAQHWSQRITLYDDVELLAHALQDDDYATSLIETYITPLDGEHHGAVLRKTLEAFCEVGYNEEKAADLLNVHRHTVQRHLRRIEKLADRQFDTHQVELGAALRLAQMLGAPASIRRV
jgi:hypothetical protein